MKHVIVQIRGGCVMAVECDDPDTQVWVIDEDSQGEYWYYEDPETKPGDAFKRLDELRGG